MSWKLGKFVKKSYNQGRDVKKIDIPAILEKITAQISYYNATLDKISTKKGTFLLQNCEISRTDCFKIIY